MERGERMGEPLKGLERKKNKEKGMFIVVSLTAAKS